MCIYVTAIGRISSGVPMATRSGSENASPSIIIAMPPTMDSMMAVWMDFETISSSCAPKYWEIITVAPDERPVKKPMRRLIAVPVPPPTAASACFPRYWPTTIASTVL